jgi:NAD(P)-dependent dehydrogenase (short-subunit alcohol dehydrogenase family)
MRLAGKVAIITGSGSGIGRASAVLFAREGASVVAVDWNPTSVDETVEQIRMQGGKALAVHADVSSETDVERMVSAALSAYGRLDVLFNNAGVQVFGKVAETSTADWHKVMDINLMGYFLGCKVAIPPMIRQGGGSIVNTSSCLGLVGDPDMPAYCATKGGILAMTRSIAQAHGRDGIRANCICPGDVETPLVAEYFCQQADPQAARAQVITHYALGRIATPEDIAYTALFLASDESAFITGTYIVVDGGLTSRCY